jgi:hypothetical protein
MEASSYRLMAGQGEKAVLAKWRAALPGKSASLDPVFDDIVREVRAYAPVTKVTLGAGKSSEQGGDKGQNRDSDAGQ